ncbi:MAG: cytochrome c maturation protein CcmE [Acidobacteria bacterium]|nr:cytochrome c maturation protein CcmE [Acidobacteriota bacterium]
MKTKVKFVALAALIVGALAWLATGGISETKTYYKTIAELDQLNRSNAALGKRLRVAGDVEPGSIVRKGRDVEFVMKQDALRLKVVYNGVDPLPDTFRDGAQALADGKLDTSGVFQASRIQAKCASKYEAKPVRTAPVNERRQAS